jgi:3-hydroxyacyl-CoA dehydrogenase/enoyl-CoA hydratase/carnithine racemase
MKRAFSFGDKSVESAVRRVNAIRRVAVIGAGTMGQGIAIDLLRKTGCHVVLLDVRREALERARGALGRLWAADVKGGRMREEDARALEARTGYTTDYADVGAEGGCDIIWEAATEREDVKATIFRAVERAVDPERLAAIFSNTSSHTTAELAGLFTREAFREKFLTVHGYYPFEQNRLIDVMRGPWASAETFALGVVFADQVLEKTVMALGRDHHGYITDPIFQAMGAIVSWDVRTAEDIVSLGGLWDLFTSNPFTVLDQTGHMPYTESSRHCGLALPANDRLRGLYLRDGKHYPDWIAALEERGYTGVASPSRRGFFAWGEGERARPERVLDPATGVYVAIGEPSRKEFWSYYEAGERDRRAGTIKSAESLVHVAGADDAGGRAFRRYVLPIVLYALDMIQDGYATPGQVNSSTRAGLRFKVGLIEVIDALMAHLTVDGLLQLIRRARDESAGDPCMVAMLDTEGKVGPRAGRPCLLHELRGRGVDALLGYGVHSRTPVAELDVRRGREHAPAAYIGSYPDLRFVEPSSRDRVATIVFNNPLRGNVFNKQVIDQLTHAFGRVLDLHRAGKCGAVLFTAAGTGMRMLGADAREFNRGWFERETGYAPLSEEQAGASSRNAVGLFRLIQTSPVPSIGVFGEKWGGGAEFTYFLDLRYDVRQFGLVFDPLERASVWQQKTTYNQPEIDYAILAGFGGPGELRRLGLGDSHVFELFDQGMTADRAYQVGLCNGVFDDEHEALRRGYERARQMAKDPPYSRALFKKELARGIDDAALARETGETFNPSKNPYIRTGLLKLLDRSGKTPPIDYTVNGVELPGWSYPLPNTNNRLAEPKPAGRGAGAASPVTTGGAP